MRSNASKKNSKLTARKNIIKIIYFSQTNQRNILLFITYENLLGNLYFRINFHSFQISEVDEVSGEVFVFKMSKNAHRYRIDIDLC